MADWLAHGLEQAFADTPEVAVLRKHRTHSGLIRETRGDPPDWPVLAREILAAEKPAFVVMMIGHNDLKSIRERAAARARPPAATPAAPAPAQPPAQAGRRHRPRAAQTRAAAGRRGGGGACASAGTARAGASDGRRHP